MDGMALLYPVLATSKRQNMFLRDMTGRAIEPYGRN